MLIGSEALDYAVIRSLAFDTAGLVAYVESLVPTWARHIPQIKMNQRYYAAVHIRNMLQIPFQTRRQMYSALLDGCSIHGIVSNFVPISQLFELCDVDALIQMLRRDYEEEA